MTTLESQNGDVVIGSVHTGGSRTITDAEIAFLPALMGAINPLFHDEVSASAGPLRGRVLYGPALLGIAVALTEHLLREHVLALVQVDEVRFRRPVRVGDTVSASFRVTNLVASATKPESLLTVDDTVTNQNNETVLTFQRTIKIRKC
jgi:acyl dehydratase